MTLNEEQKKLANKLTNWQRNQWARAGYPADKIQKFLDLRRPKKDKAKP